MKENTQNQETKKDYSLPIIIIVALIIVTGLWLLTYSQLKDWRTSAERGQFGDMFGAVNAAFSGLAFAGIIITIWLQRKELALQRQELILTRKELERSATAQQKSEQALTKQAHSLKNSAQIAGYDTLVKYYAELEQLNIRGVPADNLSRGEILEIKKDYLQKLKDILKDSEAR